MDAMEYGNIPQQRTRIFIVGFLDYEQCRRFSFPEPIDLTVDIDLRFSHAHASSF